MATIQQLAFETPMAPIGDFNGYYRSGNIAGKQAGPDAAGDIRGSPNMK